MASLRDHLADLADHLRRGLDPDAHAPLLPDLPGGRWWASWVLPDGSLERVDRVTLRDAGHGYDAFGMSRDGVALGLAAAWPLYRRWFRVVSHGIDHVPAEGPVVLAANHSGTLPLDGVMICADVLQRASAPRVPRAVLAHFAARLPFVSPLFTRAGAVGGHRANAHELLARGELLLVFPEGTAGIGKPFSQRYQLQRWTEGHAELAIRHGAPVVPVAVVGAEEQLPQVARVGWLHPLGAPWVPIPAAPCPLPVRYHLWYGAPIRLHERHPPEAADDPQVVRAAADEVRDAVAALIARGLAERPGVFV